MTTKKFSPIRAIRAFCRECDPEPPGAFLRCDVRDCALWRHRCGSGNRLGKACGRKFAVSTTRPGALSPRKGVAQARARLLILATEAEAKSTGKRHFTSSEWWPHGELEYKPGERAVRAVGRHCGDCCGGAREVKTSCCSPACPLAPFRFGRRLAKGAPAAHGAGGSQ